MHSSSAVLFTAACAILLTVGAGTVDFYNPADKGGSLLNRSAGLGEPLNVIISGKSSPEVLTVEGFLNYARAVGLYDLPLWNMPALTHECFNIHKGDPQPANLGDGRGYVSELAVYREYFDIPIFGSCLESLLGGNHFRIYPQNGTEANSGALFLAVSQEEDATEHHNIIPDGYNIGRDNMVASAVGRHRFLGRTYDTVVTELHGLLAPGSEGINHGIAQDGVVKMLTVTIKR